jgi:hypothetical protein
VQSFQVSNSQVIFILSLDLENNVCAPTEVLLEGRWGERGGGRE